VICSIWFDVQAFLQTSRLPKATSVVSASPGGLLNVGATPLPKPAVPVPAQTITGVAVHLYGGDDPVHKKCRVRKYWYSLGTPTTVRVAGFQAISSSSQPELYAAVSGQLKQWCRP